MKDHKLNYLFLLGIILLGGAVYAVFRARYGPLASANPASPGARQSAERASSDIPSTEHETTAHARSARSPAGPGRGSVEAFDRDDSFGVNLGPLDEEGIKLVNSYILSLLQSAKIELDRLPNGTEPGILEKQANALRRAKLWEGVRRALGRGDYVVVDPAGSKMPRPTEERLYQKLALPKSYKGRRLDVVFVLDREHYHDVFATAQYKTDIHRYACEEAARAYNALPDRRRAELLREYLSAMHSGGWMSMSEDLRNMFPLGNTVDNRTLIMRVPR